MKYEVKDLNAPSRWNMRIWDDIKKEWFCQSDKERLTYYGFDITGGETTEFQGLPKWYPDRHLIWEQSTGLKDKNGKEIYEGDIIESSYLNGDGNGGYYDAGNFEVVFKNGAFGVMRKESFYTFDEIEWDEIKDLVVIGTIHENPELLGGEE